MAFAHLSILLSPLLAATPPPERLAELPPTFAVFAGAQDDASKPKLGAVEQQMIEALSVHQLPVADIDAAFPKPAPPDAKEGQALVDEGKNFYDNLDTDHAAKSLAKAAVWFIKHPEAATAEKMGEIFLFLGASELANDAKKEAAKSFLRAVQLNPDVTADPKLFPSQVAKALEAAKKELAQKPKGKLVIDSDPGGAFLEIAGLSKGPTPTEAIELPAGRYLVTFNKPGYARSPAFPDVTAEKTVETKVVLQTSPEYAAARAKAASMINPSSLEATYRLPLAAEDLGKKLQSRYLVMIAVSTADGKTQQQAHVWDLNSGQRLRDLNYVDRTSLAAVATQIAEWSRNAPAWQPTPVAVAEKPPPAWLQGPLYQKWWFWTGVGVIAAGAATTIAVAAQPQNRGFNLTLTPR